MKISKDLKLFGELLKAEKHSRNLVCKLTLDGWSNAYLEDNHYFLNEQIPQLSEKVLSRKPHYQELMDFLKDYSRETSSIVRNYEEAMRNNGWIKYNKLNQIARLPKIIQNNLDYTRASISERLIAIPFKKINFGVFLKK